MIKKIKTLFHRFFSIKEEQIKQIQDLESKNNNELKNEDTEVSHEVNDHKDSRDIYKNTIKSLSGELDIEIKLALKRLKSYDAKEVFELLKPLDPDGWNLYWSSKEILGIDVYKEFYTEDNMGRFEESDGYELKHYVEIAAFGDCTYRIVGNAYEVLDKYSIDYNSKEYETYINKLYPLAIEKIVDRGNREEPINKLQVLRNLRSYQKEHEVTVETEEVEMLAEINKEIDLGRECIDWELER
ncbi:MAG: hypothetical protein CVV02_01710 [Firmicutes bacterium HGW-Firmicutes-7]|nr:MAG: hypothetical protein CVV02_01710 [Firmicutes bacterium HGW-Firmicutes-7]